VKKTLDDLNKLARSNNMAFIDAPKINASVYKLNKEYVVRDINTNEQILPKTKARKTVENFLNTLEYKN